MSMCENCINCLCIVNGGPVNYSIQQYIKLQLYVLLCVVL